MNFGRSTRIRTLDPLVPNQVRYQTAPHSDKTQIIARTDTFSVSGFPFFLPRRRRVNFVWLAVSIRSLCDRGLHAVAGRRRRNALALKLLAEKVQQNIGLRLAEAFTVSMTVT